VSRPEARVVSVNVSQARTIVHGGQPVSTGIYKSPVGGRVRVRRQTLDGDVQADLAVHGGPDRAVYAYGLEDLAHWSIVQQREVEPGAMGENLTTSGLELAQAVVGERWRVGTAVLEVTSPRLPCYKLGIRLGDPTFVQKFARGRRPGAYLRVITEGELARGDAIDIVQRPDHGVTVGMVVDVYYGDHTQAARLLRAPQLAARWAERARQVVESGRIRE
jgi:MOSC domain-containing protein YiiM